MAKRRGATTRDPKVRTQPVDDGTTKAERRRIRRAENRTATERLSPGVYRSKGGGLVSQQGERIRRQPGASVNPWAAQGEALYGAMPSPEQIGGAAGMMPGQAGQVGQAAGSLYEQLGGGRTRTLSPEERLARGIDPRDPNQYFVDEQGNVGGTLIGWSPNQPSMNDLASITGQQGGQLFDNQMGTLQGMPQMPQASANQGGKYRLSPGVYGTREQAMNQYNQQLQQMGFSNGLNPFLRTTQQRKG